ncbi:PREDICTED: tubulin polyglutamylase ttll6-like [Nicrophorus vespilloides]|uniref:Tubulin polyglutamylase ttll6-like n=1 Tax=Nicrophorus vespilloides TaxID=110193 RepID=A0ABM1LZZ1_NICVS|nr:PREDICTED: tubulin polyglutamylase ttll6-like [Nicrophorus vespilloides]
MVSDSSYTSSESEKEGVVQKVVEPPQFVTNNVERPKKRKRSISVCLTNCRYDVIRKITQSFGYKESGDAENWNLYWTDWSISVERCKEMKRYQKINHFPGMLEICRKDLLARNLNRMQRLFPKEYNFFPKTWCLPADLGDVLAYSRTRKHKTYILKPDAGSQGKGITLCKNMKDVNPSERLICQVYIARPFLIDGYKFDLRVYTLITSCDPLRIYVYKEGLVRFATSRYKEPTGVNISNVFMHLTNYAVNKHSRTYNQDTEAGSKRKLSWFNAYLRNLGYDVEKLWKCIDEVIIKTVISAFPILKHSYLACFPNHDVIPACCELLGTDIILDRKLNPQLLEVNHSPSFHTDTELDCEVKEALIGDMFSMMNLEKCDKRRIIREDRKKIRERLQGLNLSKESAVSSPNFSEYYKHEMSNRGDFRLVFPTNDHSFDKFYHQGVNSIYSSTQATKARITAQAIMREEMLTKAKIEAEKRISNLKAPIKPKPPPPSPPEARKLIRFPAPNTVVNSFEPQMIVEAEEHERLQRLSQRDFLVRKNGLLEHIYFSMKVNGTLRSQDEKKYAIFDKLRTTSDNHFIKGPAISDLLEGIRSSGATLLQRGHDVHQKAPCTRRSCDNRCVL